MYELMLLHAGFESCHTNGTFLSLTGHQIVRVHLISGRYVPTEWFEWIGLYDMVSTLPNDV